MKRITFVDTAKGIGILCIVLGHTVPNTFLHHLLYSFHVPLFFILAGLTYKNKDNKLLFIISKARRLLLPYVCFAVISILIFYIMTLIIPLQGDSRIIPNLIGMVYANSNSGYMTWNRPLWFLPCLFATTLLVDIFETCMLTRKKENIRFFRYAFLLFSWGIGCTVNVFLQNFYLPLQLESSLFLAGFFELGIILSGKENHIALTCAIREKKNRYWIVLCILICVGTVLSCINGSTDIRTHQFGKYPICLVLTSLILSFATLIIAVKLEHRKWLQYIGVSSLSIMLMHKFPILFFQEVFPGTKVLLDRTNTFSGFFCGSIVSIITVIMCLIAERIIIAICPFILGITKEK